MHGWPLWKMAGSTPFSFNPSPPSQIKYYAKYHRCIIYDRKSYIEQFTFLFLPFSLIVLMYCVMLTMIAKHERRCGRFLLTATCIIVTSLLAYAPTVIANTWDVNMSYEVSQILTVTCYYVNGVLNPVIYLGLHPVARQYLAEMEVFVRLCGPRHGRRGTMVRQDTSGTVGISLQEMGPLAVRMPTQTTQCVSSDQETA